MTSCSNGRAATFSWPIRQLWRLATRLPTLAIDYYIGLYSVKNSSIFLETDVLFNELINLPSCEWDFFYLPRIETRINNN
jgi:hypothetical protein